MATDLADFINMAAQRARGGAGRSSQLGGSQRMNDIRNAGSNIGGSRPSGALPYINAGSSGRALGNSQRAADIANAEANTQGLVTGGSARALGEYANNIGKIRENVEGPMRRGSMAGAIKNMLPPTGEMGRPAVNDKQARMIMNAWGVTPDEMYGGPNNNASGFTGYVQLPAGMTADDAIRIANTIQHNPGPRVNAGWEGIQDTAGSYYPYFDTPSGSPVYYPGGNAHYFDGFNPDMWDVYNNRPYFGWAN